MFLGLLFALITLKEPARLLEQVRGVPAPADLKVEVIPRDRIRPYLQEAIRDSYGDRFDDLADLYKSLGLLPPGMDAKKALLDLYQSQVAAFYNPKDHTMKIIEGMDPDQPYLKVILVHELVHALQDRRLPLYKMMMERALSRDNTLALQTLLEGEAVLVMTMASIKSGDRGVISDPKMETEVLEKSLSLYSQDLTGLLPDAPKFFVNDLLVPYQVGVRYVFEAYKKGGWKAVDELYRRIPCCMEQILHPSGKGDCPTLKSAADRLGLKGSSPVISDSLGESGFEYIFDAALDKAKASAACAGWDGDEAVLYKGKKGKTVVWFTRWDTEEDREEAVVAMLEYGKKANLKVRPVVGGRSAVFFIPDAKSPAADPPGTLSDIIRALEESHEQSCPER